MCRHLTFNVKRFCLSGIEMLARSLTGLPGVSGDKAYSFLRKAYRCVPLPDRVKRRLGRRLLQANPDMMQADLAWKARSILGFPSLLSCIGDATPLAGEHAGSSNDPTGRIKVLVVEHRIPTPDRTSGSVRLDAILRAMHDMGWDVTFVSDSPRKEYHWVLKNVATELPRYEQRLNDLGIRVCYEVQGLMQILNTEGGAFRFAFLSYPEIAYRYTPLVRAFMPWAELIYDTVDLHFLRFRREAEVKGMDAELQMRTEHYERIETANLQSADVVIAITGEEKGEILERVPESTVEIIPNIHQVADRPAACADRSGLVFIGHYLHAPNVDAVKYFVSDILPRVRARLGDVDFFMLGSSMTEEIKSLASPGVHAVGYVEDPDAWFEKARVFVAPLRFGAGMKGKIGHSLSCGLPVVTTSIGAEGMGLEHGTHALIDDDARAFADNIVRVYEDDSLWGRLSANGMAHVRKHFSQQTLERALVRIASNPERTIQS